MNHSSDNVFPSCVTPDRTEYLEIRSPSINPTVYRRVDEGSEIKIFNTLGECVRKLTPTLSQGEGIRIEIDYCRDRTAFCQNLRHE